MVLFTFFNFYYKIYVSAKEYIYVCVCVCVCIICVV